MTYLKRIEQCLTTLSSEIESKQAELQALLTQKADLETVKRVLQTLPGDDAVVPDPATPRPDHLA